jgi:transglutaminase-like putative cysteine protease
MKRWMAILGALLLGGCAVQPVIQAARRFFHDELFAASADRIRADDIFALSDGMRRHLDDEIAPRAAKRGRQLALVDALYRGGDLKLDYDSAQTRNAAEAFAARTGNCLSLVIMTAAFAKALALPVE